MPTHHTPISSPAHIPATKVVPIPQPAHVRYHQNMKVLRRRDPSILTIIDSFSMVSTYRHEGGEGGRWVAGGCDGPMFLFECSTQPRYGFYILNRSGHMDHIQRMKPSDKLKRDRRISGKNYLFISSADDEHSHTNVLGLWSYTEVALDVIEQLYGYIKRDEPYPEELKYGPDRLPPNSHTSRGGVVGFPGHPAPVEGSTSGTGNDALDALFANMTRSSAFLSKEQQRRSFAEFEEEELGDSHYEATTAEEYEQQQLAYPEDNADADAGDEEDEVESRRHDYDAIQRLADKSAADVESDRNAQARRASYLAAVSVTNARIPNPQKPQQQKMTVESLFAALNGSSSQVDEEEPEEEENAMTPQGASTSIPLLDSIFASASTSDRTFTQPEPQPKPKPRRQNSKQQLQAPPVPQHQQVLTNDVLIRLLGMPSSSSAPTILPPPQTPKEEEDDDDEEDRHTAVDDTNADDETYSTSSTVLDLEAEDEVRAAGASAGVPILSSETASSSLSIAKRDDDENDEIANEKKRGALINGDATPRALPSTMGMDPYSPSPPPLPPSQIITPQTASPIPRAHSQPTLPRNHHTTSSSSSLLHSALVSPAHSVPPSFDFLPPSFSSSSPSTSTTTSLLWPSQPSLPNTELVDEEEEDEIVELDFSDTRALSDMDLFDSQERLLRSTTASLSGRSSSRNSSVYSSISTPASLGAVPSPLQHHQQQRQLEVPATVSVNGNGNGNANGQLLELLHSSSAAIEKKKTRRKERHHADPSPPVPVVNGHAINGKAKAPAPPVASTLTPAPVNNDDSTATIALQTILSTLSKSSSSSSLTLPPSTAVPKSRNEFVRELLTLIHTDKGFVDRLWEEYQARL